MSLWQVAYMDRNGAGCVRTFNSEVSMEAFVKKLHTAARIYLDGRPIGEVYRATGEVDDKRVKWLWSFETEGE